MTPAEHEAQRRWVLASLRLADTTAVRHDVYPRRDAAVAKSTT